MRITRKTIKYLQRGIQYLVLTGNNLLQVPKIRRAIELDAIGFMSNISIIINGQMVESKSEMNVLGVIFDKHLKWSA